MSQEPPEPTVRLLPKEKTVMQAIGGRSLFRRIVFIFAVKLNAPSEVLEDLAYSQELFHEEVLPSTSEIDSNWLTELEARRKIVQGLFWAMVISTITLAYIIVSLAILFTLVDTICHLITGKRIGLKSPDWFWKILIRFDDWLDRDDPEGQ